MSSNDKVAVCLGSKSSLFCRAAPCNIREFRSSATRLYSIGIDLEAAREKLRKFVADGVPFDSDQMRQGYEEFAELDRQWNALEQQHLELRDEMMKDGQIH